MSQSTHHRLAVVLARHPGERAPLALLGYERLDEDLGLDPLDLVLIALRLEGEVGDEFPLAKLEGVRTVADLERVVARWMARRGAYAA